MRAYLWFLLHNLVAHPALVLPFEWVDRFHEWSHRRFHEADDPAMESFGPACYVLGGLIVASLGLLLAVGAIDVVGTLAGWLRARR